MHRIGIVFTFLSLLGTFLLAACSSAPANTPPPPTPDVQATVNAAVAATATAEAMLQEMVDTAVEEAVEEAVDAAVEEAVNEALASATPQPEYATYSEEELVVLIEETSAEAEANTEAYAEATETAVSDGEVTAEEVETIELYVSLTEETLTALDAMIETYYALYGETADAILVELVAIEEELALLNENLAQMTAVLEEINTTLEAGLTLAEETIAQLEQAATEAQTVANQVATQASTWAELAQATAGQIQENVTAVQDDLMNLLTNTQPDTIATNAEETITMLLNYATTANNALTDNTISTTEMQSLAQLGANIIASLEANPLPQADMLINNINTLNTQLAQGELQNARASLNTLQAQIPQPGSLGGGITLPGGGGRPGGRP